jgi:hypothetical protein
MSKRQYLLLKGGGVKSGQFKSHFCVFDGPIESGVMEPSPQRDCKRISIVATVTVNKIRGHHHLNVFEGSPKWQELMSLEVSTIFPVSSTTLCKMRFLPRNR